MEVYTLLYKGQKVTNVQSVRITSCANTLQELTPGSVCAAMLEVTGLGDAPSLATGEAVSLTRGQRDYGIFYVHSLRRLGRRWELNAYDAVSLLDLEVDQWLYNLTGWPYTLQKLAQMLLEYCGITVVNSLPVNADHPVQAFSGSGITARTLLGWICQVGGCFCRAAGEKAVEFGWFATADIAINPTGENFYYADGLQVADYTTHPIEKVQLRLTSDEIGAVYPDNAEKTNAVILTGNYLLTTDQAAVLEEAAKNLYEQLKGSCHTPWTLRTSADTGIRVGDIFTVTDTDRNTHIIYAMNCVEKDGVLTVTSTGDARRSVQMAINTARYEALTGRVLALQADIEGVKIENRDAQENLAALTLEVEGIASKVVQNESQEEQTLQKITTLQQNAESLSLQVEQIAKNGSGSVTTSTGYTFNEEGLKIAKAGQEMENLLDNTGMYVRRSGDVILQANSDGVVAKDVTVQNYLIIGSHARFEDYPTGRTACFYIE